MSSVNLYLFWKYLNQPLFSSKQPAILDLNQFFQQHRVELLQYCWNLDTFEDNLMFEHHPNLSLFNQIIHLERCWNLVKKCY
ncbi:MAG: hypothetical protein ACKO24_01745 [Leptolyngbyaceae cyanobacterium]